MAIFIKNQICKDTIKVWTHIITVGSLGAALVAPSCGSYVNYNTSCDVCRRCCVNNRIPSQIYCKIQHFFGLCSRPATAVGSPLDPATEVHGALKTLIIKWLEKSRGRAAGHGAGTTTRPRSAPTARPATRSCGAGRCGRGSKVPPRFKAWFEFGCFKSVGPKCTPDLKHGSSWGAFKSGDPK